MDSPEPGTGSVTHGGRSFRQLLTATTPTAPLDTKTLPWFWYPTQAGVCLALANCFPKGGSLIKLLKSFVWLVLLGLNVHKERWCVVFLGIFGGFWESLPEFCENKNKNKNCSDCNNGVKT